MTSRLEIDPTALAELLTGPSGPVYRAVRDMAEAIVDEVKARGPLGFDQAGERAVGALRADMSIRGESVGENDIRITVGTDPVNVKRYKKGSTGYDYHYAAAVHRGRAEIDSALVMRFVERNGAIRWTHHVGPATARPFLYDAVNAINVVSPLHFELIERDENV